MNTTARAASGALVIGYGNPLRGDDGLGPHIAAVLESRRNSNVRVLIAQQLTPELAEELSRVEVAVFVDASVQRGRESIEIARLPPARRTASMTHVFAPETLLALSEAIYGRAPEAWSVNVLGETFEPGEGLSAPAQERAAAAVRSIESLLATVLPTLVVPPHRLHCRT